MATSVGVWSGLECVSIHQAYILQRCAEAAAGGQQSHVADFLQAVAYLLQFTVIVMSKMAAMSQLELLKNTIL